MKLKTFARRAAAAGAVLAALTLAALPALAAPKVQVSTTNAVADHADILSDETEQYVNDVSIKLSDACGAQIGVYTLDELLGSTTMEGFAYDVFNAWGLGSDDLDNGVLLLLAPNEADGGDYYIMRGDGLESQLSFSTLGSLLDEYMEPYWVNGDYDTGTQKTVQALANRLCSIYGVTLNSSYTDTSAPDKGGPNVMGFVLLVVAVLLVIWLITYLMRPRGPRPPRGGGGGSSNASKLEEYAMTPEWINYATAVSSELLDDCVGLWASWNGPSGIPDEDWNRIGRDFFSKNTIVGADGYAQYMRTASEGNDKFTSGVDAIRTILVDGFANISNEVGSSKIGNPNSLALSGQTNEAVLQVESWYSWNSITDYSDNIISIKNGYAGRRGAIGDPADANSISAYVKSQDADLDARMTAAIDGAYNAIKSMQAPFRNNLTGSKVDAAITACSDLTELTEGSLLGLFENAGDYDFTAILTQYADQVVTPTYKDLKEKAWALYNAMVALQADNRNQSKVDAACTAWRTMRVPWEQSEAVLFGPAGEETGLGFDPSMDSWPLDQEDIATIITNKNLSSVDDYIGAIGSESVRGFHTIELLLFKDGQNRKVLAE